MALTTVKWVGLGLGATVGFASVRGCVKLVEALADQAEIIVKQGETIRRQGEALTLQVETVIKLDKTIRKQGETIRLQRSALERLQKQRSPPTPTAPSPPPRSS